MGEVLGGRKEGREELGFATIPLGGRAGGRREPASGTAAAAAGGGGGGAGAREAAPGTPLPLSPAPEAQPRAPRPGTPRPAAARPYLAAPASPRPDRCAPGWPGKQASAGARDRGANPRPPSGTWPPGPSWAGADPPPSRRGPRSGADVRGLDSHSAGARGPRKGRPGRAGCPLARSGPKVGSQGGPSVPRRKRRRRRRGHGGSWQRRQERSLRLPGRKRKEGDAAEEAAEAQETGGQEGNGIWTQAPTGGLWPELA